MKHDLSWRSLYVSSLEIYPPFLIVRSLSSSHSFIWVLEDDVWRDMDFIISHQEWSSPSPDNYVKYSGFEIIDQHGWSTNEVMNHDIMASGSMLYGTDLHWTWEYEWVSTHKDNSKYYDIAYKTRQHHFEIWNCSLFCFSPDHILHFQFCCASQIRLSSTICLKSSQNIDAQSIAWPISIKSLVCWLSFFYASSSKYHLAFLVVVLQRSF